MGLSLPLLVIGPCADLDARTAGEKARQARILWARNLLVHKRRCGSDHTGDCPAKRAGVPNPVQGVKDGPEAIRYLRGEGPYANRVAHPLPELVLLDLRLPGMHGFEVLQWIRRQPRLTGLTVVVVTGMEAAGDVERA